MGSSTKGIHFTDAHPGTGPPCRRKRGDEHTRAEDENTSDELVRWVLLATNSTKDDEPGHLPKRTGDEGLAAAELLNEPQAREGTDNIDSSKDDLGDVGVGDTNRLEDTRTCGSLATPAHVVRNSRTICTIIEEVVSPSELLTNHQKETQHSPVQGHALRIKTRKEAGLSGNSSLPDEQLDILELGLNEIPLIPVLLPSDETEGRETLFVLVMGKEPPWRFGKEEHSADGQTCESRNREGRVLTQS